LRAPFRQPELDLQRRQMRSPAHALRKVSRQTRHPLAFNSGTSSATGLERLACIARLCTSNEPPRLEGASSSSDGACRLPSASALFNGSVIESTPSTKRSRRRPDEVILSVWKNGERASRMFDLVDRHMRSYIPDIKSVLHLRAV
jgi:hypothetical protein